MRTLDKLQLDGGCLAFDFTNTVNTRKPSTEFDYIKTYEDFLAWSKKVGLLPPKRLQAISEAAADDKRGASKALNEVVRTREQLYRFFSPVAAGKLPAADALKTFNKLLANTLQNISIRFHKREPEILLTSDEVSLDEPLRIVIKSAFDVLTTEDRARIKECPGCGWLFLDTSKSGKRKWCDMQVCGSREKSLRHYYKKKKE